MAEYLEYNIEFDQIQEQDMPENGMIYIYKEYDRKDIEWWIVSKFGGIKLGKFWDIDFARIFAETL